MRWLGNSTARNLGSSVANMRDDAEHACPRELIEQRALTRVRIADQSCNRWHGDRLAPLALLLADAANWNRVHPSGDGFDPGCGDDRFSSLVSPGPRVPMPPPSCDIDFALAAQAAGAYIRAAPTRPGSWPSRVRAVPGKDVQNKLGAVEHAARKRGFQVAQLPWASGRGRRGRGQPQPGRRDALRSLRLFPGQRALLDRAAHGAASTRQTPSAPALTTRSRNSASESSASNERATDWLFSTATSTARSTWPAVMWPLRTIVPSKPRRALEPALRVAGATSESSCALFLVANRSDSRLLSLLCAATGGNCHRC